jgi:hypothetical protein
MKSCSRRTRTKASCRTWSSALINEKADRLARCISAFTGEPHATASLHLSQRREWPLRCYGRKEERQSAVHSRRERMAVLDADWSCTGSAWTARLRCVHGSHCTNAGRLSRLHRVHHSSWRLHSGGTPRRERRSQCPIGPGPRTCFSARVRFRATTSGADGAAPRRGRKGERLLPSAAVMAPAMTLVSVIDLCRAA